MASGSFSKIFNSSPELLGMGGLGIPSMISSFGDPPPNGRLRDRMVLRGKVTGVEFLFVYRSLCDVSPRPTGISRRLYRPIVRAKLGAVSAAAPQ